MKNILITGGAGFIGSHLADNLFKSGKYKITILDNLSEKTHSGSWPLYLNKNFKLIYGDVTDRKALTTALESIDIVFHLAAELDLNPEYQRFMNVNVGSTALLFEIIKKNKIKIEKVLIASTQFVYGNGLWTNRVGKKFYPKTRSIDDELLWDFYDNGEKLVYNLCSENQEINPPNHYALSKYFQEKLALNLGELNDIDVRVLRFSIIHGIRQSIKNTYSGALRTLCYFANLKQPFSTFEDNNSLRDFTPVFDAVEACRIVLEKGSPFEIYNISNGKSTSVYQLAEMISKEFSIKSSFSEKVEWRHGDIRHAISNNKKILDLGFIPLYKEKDIVKDYVKWFKKQNLDFERFQLTQKKMRQNGQIRSF
jgi:dTDP-L-rhamnose 4-epimerase